MLKVLIVDDEPIVREGLKSIICWQEYGYEICGEGIDGRDGLEKVLTLNPDLVLMDIKMPGMQGIEVIKAAKEAGYNGKSIILTGYSDFEYAQSSIKLGINSYLLKPIDEDELIDTIKKLYEDVEREKKLKRQLTDSKRYLKEAVINRIINGVENLDGLQTDISSCNIKLSFDSFQVALIEEQEKGEKDSSKFTQHVEEYFKSYNHVDIVYKDGLAILLIKGAGNLEAERLLERFNKSFVLHIKKDVIIVLGRVVQSLGDVKISYKDCQNLLNRRFFYNKSFMFWQSISKQQNDEQSIALLHTYTEDLYTYIEISDFEKIEDKLNTLQKFFINSNYTPDKVKGICVNIFGELKDKIITNYNNLRDLILSREDIIHGIYDKNTLLELIEYMCRELKELANKLCNDSSENVMKRILNYIEKNYHKDIKLEGLAEIFNYNSAYLGKMFKNYTGENFNSYIDKIRIENAKQLLSSKEFKVYEVSEKVGYKNIDYFYGKFKKYVGISPKEFKKATLN
jgi:two-component system response regulator YesN